MDNLAGNTNNNDYINDFEKIKSLLNKKYENTVDKLIWKDDLFKGDKSNYGLAVITERLQYVAR